MQDDDIHDLIKTMVENNIREVPVVDKDGKILGFITILMLLKEWLKGSLV